VSRRHLLEDAIARSARAADTTSTALACFGFAAHSLHAEELRLGYDINVAAFLRLLHLR
jgi:hypothetical protein